VVVPPPEVVDEVQLRRRAAGTERRLCGLQQRAHLRVAVGGLPDRFPVESQRDVVEEQAPVDPRQVDAPLDAVSERVERADRVVAIEPEIQGEVVACAGGDAHEGEPVRVRGRGGDRERSVATCDAERIGAPATAWRTSVARS
jgi:hypothetical protein